MRYLIILFCLFSPELWGQNQATWPLDPVNFARIKNFSAHRASSNNLYVNSNDDCKHPVPGETVVLADLKGPGIVNHIWITIADSEYGWPRLLRFRVYYDGHKTPSVDVPVGDFFGVGHGYERDLNSQIVRNASFGRARNSYWAMPFRKSLKMTLTNEGSRRITSLYYHVDWQKHDSLPEDVGYFHSYYQQAMPPASGRLYTLLNIRGEGHYVGTVLNIIQTQMGWFGEGDEMFYVDDATTPSIEGTGTEDYFNDAWGLRVSDGAWTGIPVAEGEGFGARLTGYRWHITDPVPFKKSLRVAIEHLGWTYNRDGTARSGFEERSDFYSSVAYWYQKGVNEDLPEPPYGAARLPLGNALQIEVENNLKQTSAEKGKVSVQKEVFWSKDVLFLISQGEGAKLNIPFDVPKDGFYEVIAQIAKAPDYGDYVATLDGKQTNSTLITWGPLQNEKPPVEILHNYEPEIFVGIDHRLGWFHLTKGQHLLSFLCVGKDPLSSGYNLGVDGIVLAEIEDGEALVNATGAGLPKSEIVDVPISIHDSSSNAPIYRGNALGFYVNQLKEPAPEMRANALRMIGAFEADGVPAIDEVAASLREQHWEVRAAAALALGKLGPAASSATPQLAKLLKDENVRVREASALALRGIGEKASSAVPELSAALKDPAGTVKMAAARTLEQLKQKAAVPALIELLQIPDQTQMTNEDVQVVRNAVYALGAVGPEAREAIPALKKIQHLRIKYIAEEAIAKIEGHPVTKWH